MLQCSRLLVKWKMEPCWGGHVHTPVSRAHPLLLLTLKVFNVFLKKWSAEKNEANKRASLTADEHPPAVEGEVAVVPSLLASGNVVMSCLGFILLLL